MVRQAWPQFGRDIFEAPPLHGFGMHSASSVENPFQIYRLWIERKRVVNVFINPDLVVRVRITVGYSITQTCLRWY